MWVNTFWNEEELDQQWTESITVPIYKKGGTNECSNYQLYYSCNINSISWCNYLGTSACIST
jgi:hypothetical protein